MTFLRRNLNVPNLIAVLVLFGLLGGGYALASSGVGDSQAVTAPTGATGGSGAAEGSGETVTPEDPASEPAPVPEESHNGGSQTGAEQLTTHSHSPKGPKHGKGRGHHQGNGDQAETEHGGGPPPWAPAHGWRCQQAGNAPGSAAFHECIKAQKG